MAEFSEQGGVLSEGLHVYVLQELYYAWGEVFYAESFFYFLSPHFYVCLELTFEFVLGFFLRCCVLLLGAQGYSGQGAVFVDFCRFVSGHALFVEEGVVGLEQLDQGIFCFDVRIAECFHELGGGGNVALP